MNPRATVQLHAILIGATDNNHKSIRVEVVVWQHLPDRSTPNQLACALLSWSLERESFRAPTPAPMLLFPIKPARRQQAQDIVSAPDHSVPPPLFVFGVDPLYRSRRLQVQKHLSLGVQPLQPFAAMNIYSPNFAKRVDPGQHQLTGRYHSSRQSAIASRHYLESRVPAFPCDGERCACTTGVSGSAGRGGDSQRDSSDGSRVRIPYHRRRSFHASTAAIRERKQSTKRCASEWIQIREWL